MEKRGQIQLSFGMIFSIIIIIATVAIGFYVITYFLNLSSCTKVGIFWNSLNEEIDKAWNSDIAQKVFEKEVPSGITYLCLGNFSQMPFEADKKMFDELKGYESSGRNAYLYPPGKACDAAFYNLRHAKTDRFFCIPVRSGTLSVKISKTSLDALVKLSKP